MRGNQLTHLFHYAWLLDSVTMMETHILIQKEKCFRLLRIKANYFQTLPNIGEEETLPSTLYEANIILEPKED